MTLVAQANSTLVAIPWRECQVEIEHQWVNRHQALETRPLLVFLHEGLGSVSMWKDFPQALCEACGLPGLVYSRPAYGQSTPRADDETWGTDFMHRQALEVLPALLDALGVDQPIVLFGHSDGGSIALLFAAHHPDKCKACVVAAPHLFVEDIAVSSIKLARQAYDKADLREKLARHHRNPDSAFRGWNDAWLSPAFLDWNIEAEVSRIKVPVLAVQGEQDEYGTMKQIRKIAELAPQTRLLELAHCGHSPHRDQAALLISNVASFLEQHLGDLS